MAKHKKLSLHKIAAKRGVGQPRKFPTPESLWEAAIDYFDWVEANPIMSTKHMIEDKAIAVVEVPHLRAMTWAGFYLHSGVSRQCVDNYKKHPEYMAVIKRIEAAMYDQKFTGAASSQLRENIIARDLGLADKQEVTGQDGDALVPTDTSELARAVALLLAKGVKVLEQS